MTPQDLWNEIGIRVGSVVAGLVGGVLSLSMLPRLTFRKAVTAVLGGGACAAYGTPLAVEYLGIASRNLENGLAFVLGVVGMNLLGGAMKLSDRWRKEPSLDLDALRKPRDE
jgi:hypothetical protein